MEDFAAKENKTIKERSMYILHLDTPRIIIISSVIIGLVVISILIGMNINRQEKESDTLVRETNTQLDNVISDNNEKSHQEAIEPEKENSSINSENNTLTAKELAAPSIASNQGNEIKAENKNSGDILSNENVETIIQPESKPVIAETKKIQPRTAHNGKAIKKHRTSKKSIIEVSSVDRSSSTPRKKNFFAIQVAAFDKKSKASSTIKNLEKDKYSAFIDNTKINGKTYYRVLVGPIDSKKKAISLLNEISENSKYEDSYLIRK